MMRTTKISAVLLALLFAAGGAMAQSAAGSSTGSTMPNAGDYNARTGDSSVGTTPTNTGATKMKSTKPAKAKKPKTVNPSAGSGPESVTPTPP